MKPVFVLFISFILSYQSFAAEQFKCEDFGADYKFATHYQAYLAERGDRGNTGARKKRQEVYNQFLLAFYTHLDSRANNLNKVEDFFTLIQAAFEEAHKQMKSKFSQIQAWPSLLLESNAYPDNIEIDLKANDMRGKKLIDLPKVKDLLTSQYLSNGAAGFDLTIKFSRSAQNYNVNGLGEHMGYGQEPPIGVEDDISKLRQLKRRSFTASAKSPTDKRNFPSLQYLFCKFPEAEGTSDVGGGSGSGNAEILPDEG